MDTAPPRSAPHIVTTSYGRPALEALARAVALAKADDPLAPVTVVVPSNHVGVTARRALAAGLLGPLAGRGVGTIGVSFLTPYRLAELLGAPALAASGRRPVSTPVVAAVLRQGLQTDAGVFGPVAQHPATEEALVAAFAELADLSRPALDRVAAQSPRAADVVRLVRDGRARLADRWYDEADLVRAARAVVAGSPSSGPVRPDLGHIVVYLPQDLTRRAAALLGDLASHSPTTLVVGLTGQPAADAGVQRSLARLGLAARPDAAAPPTGALATQWPVTATATRVVTASDADDEVRAAVRVVVDAVQDGTRMERVAILYPNERPYGRLVHEHAAAAGIVVNGASAQPLKSRVLGRALLSLLSLRDHGYRRRDVLGLLASAPLDRPGAGATVSVTADWERLSRRAAVVAGRDQWDRRLGQLADELDRQADLLDAEMARIDAEIAAQAAGEGPDTAVAPADADEILAGVSSVGDVLPDEAADAADAADETERAGGEPPAPSRERRRAGRVRALRTLVLGLIDQVEAAATTARTWTERVDWLRRLGRELLGPEGRREQWPLDEREAAERVEAALDRLVGLDEIDGPVGLDVFRRTLELELDADLGRVGRFGEGVLVAPLSFGVGLDLDLVMILGLAEGVLPSRPADDSLLPDAERRASGGELPLRREHPDRQRRQLYAALRAAPRHVLCAPRGDLRASNEHVASRWFHEMTATTPNGITVDTVPSFAHAVTHLARPATEQEYRLRVPAARAADPIVATGQGMRAARRSDRFTRFDGNLAGQPVRSPLDDVVSATRLESWAVCPHAYLLRQILRVEPAEDPADTLWISALERGSLIHEVLERFVRTVLDRPAARQPGPDDPWSEADHQLMQQVGSEVCADYAARGLVGRELFWNRDRARILTRLDRFLSEDNGQRRQHQSRPVAAELAFGLPGVDTPAVDVPIAAHPDGAAGATGDGGRRSLRFRGSADRIDRATDGLLRVIDYKTGRPDDYRALSDTNPDDRGTHLQLVVYGLAARVFQREPDAAVAAEYWFVGDRPGLTTIGYQVTDDVVTRVGTTLATIVDGIEGGLFPARPTASSSDPFVRCPYCDPDGLGVTDRRHEWERKRHDPVLAPYAALAEPEVSPA